VRFLRQFAAAAAVVAVVVLIGLAWSRLAPRLPGEGPAGHAFAAAGRMVKVAPPGVKLLPRGGRPPAGLPAAMQNNGSGIPGLLPGDLLQPANLAVLRDSAFLEAAVIAAVVIADAGYRRLRRARRARATAA
jgi:hypothetical protein